jgi:tRNA(Ile)-lysidine synthase TilS/MesJ
MQCSTCRREAIIFQPYSGRYLCGDHLIRDLEAKAKRAIRVHHGMQPGDHIGVIMTGGPASSALLFFLQKLTGKRKDIRVSAVIPEGDKNGTIILNPGITKIAIATTLEDAAASVLTRILQGDVETRSGDNSPDLYSLPQITPFSHIPAGEIEAYARLCNVEVAPETGIKENDLFFVEVKSILADYSARHPAAPHAILNLGQSLAGCGTMENREGS